MFNRRPKWRFSTEKVLKAQQYPDLRLTFAPDAVREHFEGYDEYADIVDALTDEELAAIGEDALYDNDALYEAFHNGLVAALAARGLVMEEDL
jgi:pyruvate dehydrogenase complex dehydrogenase (E1) component